MSRDKKACGSALRPLILTYISLLECTSDIERCFAKVQLAEMKRRERHTTPEMLTDQLLVNLEVPGEIDALVVREPATIRLPARVAAGEKAPITQLAWRPGKLLCRAMKKYAEFFGARALASRSQKVQTMDALAAQVCRPRVQASRPCKNAVKKSMRQRWTKAAGKLVKILRTGQASGSQPSSSGSQPSSSGSRPSKPAMAKPSLEIQRMALAELKNKRKQEEVKFFKSESKSGLAAPVAPLRMKRRGPIEAPPAAKKPRAGQSPEISGASKPATGSQLVQMRRPAITDALTVKLKNYGASKPAGRTDSQPVQLAITKALAAWKLANSGACKPASASGSQPVQVHRDVSKVDLAAWVRKWGRVGQVA